MSFFSENLARKIEMRKAANALRKLSIKPDAIDFCSNDYLGFAQSSELYEKYQYYCSQYQEGRYAGSTGSRLITGNSAFTESLENYIADFHGSEAGLIFNSGYDANIGFFSSVPQRGDTVFYDAHVHASIRDGIRIGFAQSYAFEHNSLEHLMNRWPVAKGQVYVVVESVYSMDGDTAPLTELIKLCKRQNALLVVDEAHATGVFGLKGRGLVAHYELENDIFARIHTFGKALGCHGAIVLGSKALRTFLINFARSFIYTTALPVHAHMFVKAAYDLLNEKSDYTNRLHENIAYFKQKISPENHCLLPKNYIESNSPIQCFIVPGNDAVKKTAALLEAENLYVKPILSPTVSQGKERIRICLHAFNTRVEIAALAQTLLSAIKH